MCENLGTYSFICQGAYLSRPGNRRNNLFGFRVKLPNQTFHYIRRITPLVTTILTTKEKGNPATCNSKKQQANLFICFYTIPLMFKGVLNFNFRPFSFELRKIRFFVINFDLGFRVLWTRKL